MGMTIDDLKAYCMEEEATHRLRCKLYDDASGYTRSKNKGIRTACAIREELLGDYYQQIASLMRKYQQLQADYETRLKADKVATLTDIQSEFKEGLRCKGCCNNCVNACEDIPAGWFLDFFDAKINSLKENADGME